MQIQAEKINKLKDLPVGWLELLAATWGVGLQVHDGNINGILKNATDSEIEMVSKLKNEKEEIMRDIQLLLFDDEWSREKLFLLWDKHRRSA